MEPSNFTSGERSSWMKTAYHRDQDTAENIALDKVAEVA